MTNVVMISPGYPIEMAYFTRGLAAVGATVIGLGDQPRDALPAPAREATGLWTAVRQPLPRGPPDNQPTKVA